MGLNEEQRMLWDTAVKFSKEKFEPKAADWDQNEIFPGQINLKMDSFSTSFFTLDAFFFEL